MSSASHQSTVCTVATMPTVELLPENTLDDVMEVIAEPQPQMSIQLGDRPMPLIPHPGQPADVPVLPNAGVQGSANRPWHNARSIDEFANLLFHQRFSTVDEIVSAANIAELNSRERDLLTVMYSMSNATLRLVVNDLQHVVTDVMATNPSPSCLQILVDLCGLTRRLRR